MPPATHGRHRPPTAPDVGSPWVPWVVAVGVVAALVVALGVGVVVWPDSPSAPKSTVPTPTSSRTTSAVPSAAEPATTIESSRNVTIDGGTLTVEEVSDLVDGATAIAQPASGTPLGLRLLTTDVVAPDGRAATFDEPIRLTASGSLTVRNRYRLTDCPDLLPSQWPSPTEFPDATRTYLRLDGPLHTAYALCPKARSTAEPIPQLTATVDSGGGVVVRLNWQGSGVLTIRAIGSASGVAAVATESSCDGSCIVTIESDTGASLELQQVDPCPPATTEDRLTLVVNIAGRTDVVATTVKGLADAVCSSSS